MTLNGILSMSSLRKLFLLCYIIGGVCAGRKVIKSLGREANLGDFYDYVRDEFLHLSAFTDDFPDKTTELVIRESQVCKAKVIQSYSERNQFISLSTTSEISAYADFFTLSGSSEILKDFQLKAETVNAMIIFKEKRCLERIKIGRCRLSSIYNPTLGTNNGATHIVTGIRYGAEVNFGLRFKVEESLDKTEYRNGINVELQGYGKAVTSRATFDLSSSDWLKRTTFESTYHGDIRVKSPLPTNFTQVVQIIEQFSHALNETRGGKGQRIYYIVKPIHEVTNSFSCSTNDSRNVNHSNFADSTDDYYLEKLQRKILKLYYVYEENAEDLQAINQKARFHSNLISSSFIKQISNMIHQFEDCRADFSAIVRKTIVELRRNKNNSSMSEISSAMKIFRNDSTTFSYLASEKQAVLTQKISDRNSIGNRAEYAQNGETVETYLRKYPTGRVFIFYIKEIWRSTHADTLEDGFYTLLRLGGRKVVVDCDLDIRDRHCLKLEFPSIIFYLDGRLQQSDVIMHRQTDDQRKTQLAKEALEGFAG